MHTLQHGRALIQPILLNATASAHYHAHNSRTMPSDQARIALQQQSPGTIAMKSFVLKRF